MNRSSLISIGVAGVVSIVAAQMACSPVGQRGGPNCDVFDDPECEQSSGNGGSGSGNGNSSSSGDGGSIFIPPAGAGGSTGSGMQSCSNTDPNVDDDGDGYTENQADCNDCDPNVGPGAIEVLTDPNDQMAVPSDEDCNGKVDDIATFCDQNLVLEDKDPNNGARAVDLCHFVADGGPKWGVINARYVRANSAPTNPANQVGLLSNFGPNVMVRGGSRMLALATGTARLPGQPNACGQPSCPGSGFGNAPAGFPQDPPNCPVEKSIFDDVGLEVQLRAPTNAIGYKFNFKFYSFEYPEYVCMTYNDQFISLVNPPPMGSINGNISFDSQKNPVGVNIAFFDVCDGCPLGPNEMQGTGFNQWNNAGATGWLLSQAPIKGGQEFIIRWAIFDTGDGLFDSTTIVDNFQWIANGGSVTVGTVTDPPPPPK